MHTEPNTPDQLERSLASLSAGPDGEPTLWQTALERNAPLLARGAVLARVARERFELVLENVDVLSSFPVMQRKGLPFPPRVQQNFLNKKFGTEAYYTIAVKLSVQQGSAFS